MSHPVAIRPQAELDLIQHAVFLGQDNPVVAQKFLEAAQQVFAKLAQMPGLSRLREFEDPRLAGLRSYLITDAGIDVIRVLHGAQDIEEHLKE